MVICHQKTVLLTAIWRCFHISVLLSARGVETEYRQRVLPGGTRSISAIESPFTLPYAVYAVVPHMTALPTSATIPSLPTATTFFLPALPIRAFRYHCCHTTPTCYRDVQLCSCGMRCQTRILTLRISLTFHLLRISPHCRLIWADFLVPACHTRVPALAPPCCSCADYHSHHTPVTLLLHTFTLPAAIFLHTHCYNSTRLYRR